MEILELKAKEQTFLAIKEGLLKSYSREIRPNTQSKYCALDEEGYVIEINGELQPRNYDAIRFVCGKETYLCRIDDAHIVLLENNGELVTYEENGEEYIAAEVAYALGEEITADSE